MNFKCRKIRQGPRLHIGRYVKKTLLFLSQCFRRMGSSLTKSSSKQRSYAVGVLMIVLAIFVVLRAMIWVYEAVSNFDFKGILFKAGADLKKDEHGYTNILFLGTGGATHDGVDLTDTIMVASIDYTKNAVTFFSIPRDFYVNSEYNSRVNEVYRNNKATYGEEKGLEMMEKATGKISGLDIQYYAKVDFNAFVEVINELDGITVEVDKDLIDPYYPNATEDGYEPFEIRAGVHTLDGETALKYVRSRKTTSDFDRAIRQQKVLEALREKALSKDILTSPGTIKDIYQSISGNLATNISLREIISLAKLAVHLDRGRIISKVIHDDPSREGGLLYTPPREEYNGAFVLIPVGEGYTALHKYTDLIFNARDIFLNPPKIEILNGTRKEGIALQLAGRLTRFGFRVVSTANATGVIESKKALDETSIEAYRWKKTDSGEIEYQDQEALTALSQWVKGKQVSVERQGSEEPDITITLGLDYLSQGK
ncbi:LCP family protein [Candidatus Peregrinibacteria bacterium]|nr:LCP family protein [Candidatus Peregrinibacteria bacterium]